jgi:hypothetical protein
MIKSKDYDFNVTLVDWTEKGMLIKFNFSDPLKVSMGKVPDILEAKILSKNLFISKVTMEPIKNENLIVKV